MERKNMGSSHSPFDANGRPVLFDDGGQKLRFDIDGNRIDLEESAEVCTVCEDSPTGPYNYVIMREDNISATLSCPNCGESKNMKSGEVLRKRK